MKIYKLTARIWFAFSQIFRMSTPFTKLNNIKPLLLIVLISSEVKIL